MLDSIEKHKRRLKKSHFDDSPRSWPPDWKIHLREFLKTEWPKLSASTTSPPVFSTATLSSATPTQENRQAKEPHLDFQHILSIQESRNYNNDYDENKYLKIRQHIKCVQGPKMSQHHTNSAPQMTKNQNNQRDQRESDKES